MPHPLKRRPRRWYLSSMALMLFIGAPVIAATMLDGVNYREIGAITLVLICGMVIARRADRLQDELDHLENRLRGKKH